LTDYYKILNVNFGASETEIKKGFRKLATIYHPDKNGGSKLSEEAFKVILNAYEILSNKDSRLDYDIRYRQHFLQQKMQTNQQTKAKPNPNYGQPRPAQPTNKKYHKSQNSKPRVAYIFWVLIILIGLLFFYQSNKKTTGNPKGEQQLEGQKSGNRPQSGEIDFTK